MTAFVQTLKSVHSLYRWHFLVTKLIKGCFSFCGVLFYTSITYRALFTTAVRDAGFGLLELPGYSVNFSFLFSPGSLQPASFYFSSSPSQLSKCWQLQLLLYNILLYLLYPTARQSNTGPSAGARRYGIDWMIFILEQASALLWGKGGGVQRCTWHSL